LVKCVKSLYYLAVRSVFSSIWFLGAMQVPSHVVNIHKCDTCRTCHLCFTFAAYILIIDLSAGYEYAELNLLVHGLVC